MQTRHATILVLAVSLASRARTPGRYGTEVRCGLIGDSLKREKLADRLVNYGDAMAAFSVVNSLAFLVAMTETEVRCSLAGRASLVYGGLLVSSVVLTAIVVWCHRTEGRMRGVDGPLPEDVQSLRRTFLIARIVVIWLANVGSIPLVRLALNDAACLSPAA